MKNGVHFEKTTTGFGGVYMFYQCGGLYETPKFRGVAHLAEHLACKGEKKYDKDFVMNSFEANALTGDDHVCFYFSGIEDLAAKFVEKYLSCRKYAPSVTEFQSEKEIVIQEVQSALCDSTLNEAFHRGMLNYSGPCGDIEAIKNLGYHEFIEFYMKFFTKPSVVVFSGGKNMAKAYAKFKDKIDINNGKNKIQQPVISEKPNTDNYKAWSKKDSNAIVFFNSVKGNMVQMAFLLRLFGDGFYSPFYDYIRETKKLCYYISPYLGRLGKLNLFQVWTETEKEKEFTESFFEVIGNFEKFVTREYFDSYVQKAVTDIRQIKMKGGYRLAYMKYYLNEDTFFYGFDKDSPMFSYDAMVKFSKKIAKRSDWKKMSHCGDKILFTDKV